MVTLYTMVIIYMHNVHNVHNINHIQYVHIFNMSIMINMSSTLPSTILHIVDFAQIDLLQKQFRIEISPTCNHPLWWDFLTDNNTICLSNESLSILHPVCKSAHHKYPIIEQKIT